MRHGARLPRGIAALLPALVAGCGIFGDSRPGLAKVDDLVDRIERVHVESELAKDASNDAVRKLRAFAAPGFGGDAVAAYTELTVAIETSTEQARRLRAAVDAMEDAADPVFEQWTSDADGIVNSRVRERSVARLEQTRTRYDEIVTAVTPTLEQYDAINRGLHDLALFLGHDFNGGALQDIAADVQELADEVAKLDGRIESSLVAARTYLDAAAMPVTPPAGEPAGPPAPSR